MNASEQFRELYRKTRNAALANEAQKTIDGIAEIVRFLSDRYTKDVDTLMGRAKILYWQQTFGAYSQIIAKYGLSDRRVKKLFGFIVDDSLPSFNEIVKGAENVAPVAPVAPATPAAGGQGGKISIDFLSPSEKKWEKPEEPAEPVPVKPVEPRYPGATKPAESVAKAGKSFDPDSLEEFIGQSHVVRRILAEIKAANKRGERHLDHILLFGGRGLGKSTLMKLIAKHLGVRFEFMDCSQFNNDVASKRAIQKFFQNISRLEEPVVIGMDEIHALPKHIQTSLLTLLNDRNFVYLDENGVNHVIHIEDFTFIGATTDPQDVLMTVRDRCKNLTFILEPYSPEDLRKILVNKFTARGLRVTEGALDLCVGRCRSSIREINSFVKGMDTLAINADTDLVDEAVANEYFSHTGIDPIGLTKKDLEILYALLENPSGVMSEDTIASRVGVDLKIYKSEYEPYLIYIGFIQITGRGRGLTERAMAYLKGCNPPATPERPIEPPVSPESSADLPEVEIPDTANETESVPGENKAGNLNEDNK